MSTETGPASSIASAQAAAAQIRAHIPAPEVGIVLGSGLGALGERIKGRVDLPYSEIPSLPSVSIAGHQGALLSGLLGGKQVACLSGRSHLYEGHSASDVVAGVRLLAALGVKAVIVTNAAGGIAKECTPGKLMLIEDHLNLTGRNSLVGTNDKAHGPRFVDLSVAYDQGLRDLAQRTSKELGQTLSRGVYAGLLGPTYETPAEIRMLETLGASAVGMSTVLEVIALRHLGVPVLGFSCITNFAAGKSSATLNHEEVAEVAGQASENFCGLVEAICARL